MQVYISGALTHVPNLDELRILYEELGAVCQAFGLSPYIPHKYTDPQNNPNIAPSEVYSRDRAAVESSALLLAHVTLPSTGVGQEIEIAHQKGIPILLLYEKGSEPSRMVRGNPSVVGEIIFSTYEEAKAKLAEWLARFRRQ